VAHVARDPRRLALVEAPRRAHDEPARAARDRDGDGRGLAHVEDADERLGVDVLEGQQLRPAVAARRALEVEALGRGDGDVHALMIPIQRNFRT
jgi:hypothetical protein